MAKVCCIPLSYLFLRGQGVKIFSLISRTCRRKGLLIPTLQKRDDDDADEGYEGATVITPKPGVYMVPIPVLDYSSLYPNSMRERNLSHECYVNSPEYDNLPGYIYHDIYIIKKNDQGKIIRDINGKPIKVHHRFSQEIVSEEIIREEMKDVINKIDTLDLSSDDKKKEFEKERQKLYNLSKGKWVRYGTIPAILTELLNARQQKKKDMEKETDNFVKKLLDSLQLAYKITANSLYGLMGAPQSAVFFLPIAESTTSIGRERLYFAKKTVEDNFPGSEIIYGDTDSIFINFHIKGPDGQDATDRDARLKAITLGKAAAKIINDTVPQPQSIVYEKVMHPLILIAKKKYVGPLYMDDPDSSFLKAMGIVLVRRDNSPIVKVVIGGIIDHIVKHRDIEKSINHAIDVISNMMGGTYSLDQFILSKNLRGNYKNPLTIAHKVLADRMAERDPGNKPQANDRIQFVYYDTGLSEKIKNKMLQGELIETPEYLQENGLKIDYLYYLEHQIMKPATQILELMLSQKKIQKMFNTFINNEHRKRSGQRSMEDWMDGFTVNDYNSTETLRFLTEHDDKDKIFSGKKKKSEKIDNQNMIKWLDHSKGRESACGPSMSTDKKPLEKDIKSVEMDKWFK
jgi:DNA polymerase elongation subunit (family B)